MDLFTLDMTNSVLKGEIRWDSTKPDGTMRKLTDVSKLHSLGWHHKMEIKDGVKALFEWYIQNL